MRMLRLSRDIRLGIKNLLLHKLRSFLTMLGVVFGVGSVIAMLAVGEGASKQALEQIRKLGSHNIIITAMKPVEEEESTQNVGGFMSVYGLLYEDELRVAESFHTVRRTAPVKLIRKEGRLKQRALELRIVGTTPAWFGLVARPVIAGRVLSDRDAAEKANAVVLTEYGTRRLLATEATIGEWLRIGGNYFEVIGIVKSESAAGGAMQSPDQEIDAYIPLQVARERFGDVFMKHSAGSRIMERVELHQMIVEVESIEDFEPTGTIFVVGVKGATEDIRPGDDVVVVRNGELAGVGVAVMGGPEMNERRAGRRGAAVEIRHRRKAA